MTYEEIAVETDGPAGVIILDRPEKHNALSVVLLSEVRCALAELEENPSVRGVIITGNDTAFSTGADLNEALAADTPAKCLVYNRQWRSLTYQIEHLFKPVIAAINGHCITGGLELALSCDLRVAGEKATFAITSSKIGSVAGAGGTQRLPRLVGPAFAKELIFSAETIGAHDAYRMGLVNRVVPVDKTLTSSKEMVACYSERGPLSLAWAKIAMNAGMNVDLESGLDLEAALSAEAFATADKAEGMRAFLERREPRFTGS